jgi:hypothetical protein
MLYSASALVSASTIPYNKRGEDRALCDWRQERRAPVEGE